MNDQPQISTSILTPAEVAAWLRISTTAVYALCEAGELTCHRIGLGTKRKRIRIHRSAVESYLAQTKSAGPAIISLPAAKADSRKRKVGQPGTGFSLLRAAGWKG